MQKFTFTIIAGKYKGKKLSLPSLKTTRSTKTIIRESFFNTIQQNIIDNSFVEVFGGSGSIGLEAISRGAKKSYFIEIDREAFNYLRENCKKIDINRTEVIEGDSFKEFPKLLPNLPKETIFYFDPPFEIREGMENIYLKTKELIKKIPKEKAFLIAIEHRSKIEFENKIGEFSKIKTKKFGKSSISYYR